MKKPIRVLAVDDSAVMRGVLKTLFSRHAERPWPGVPDMELCGVVAGGTECLQAVPVVRPDVVVLDLEMPQMHGLDVLQQLKQVVPETPVIMCSSYTEAGARLTLSALGLGATDYVTKPSQQVDFAAALEVLAIQLLVKIAAISGDRRVVTANTESRRERPELRSAVREDSQPMEIVVIGVSTGGPSALEAMLPELPKNFPVPVLIVQHMPKLFTGALAERLDRRCALAVREAHEGAVIKAGTIWLAPGDAHMEITEVRQFAGGGLDGGDERRGVAIRLNQKPSLNHCKPSVDYLFSSAAAVYGGAALGVVMTGMGADGLAGARQLHQAGGTLLIQDEATSAVWGMPGRVFAAGLSRAPIPLGALAGQILAHVQAGRGHSKLAAQGSRKTFFDREREGWEMDLGRGFA